MLVVLTCERHVRYVDETIAQLSQGPEVPGGRWLFIDGTMKDPPAPAGWTVVPLPKKRAGNSAAIWAVLRLAAIANQDLLFFEDDIHIAGWKLPKGGTTLEYMLNAQVPSDCGLLSFINFLAAPGAPHTLFKSHPDAFGLLQGLKIPARVLRVLLYFQPQPVGPAGDWELGRALLAARLAWAAHIPDLVKHVGDWSAVEQRGGTLASPIRQGTTYAGDDFDACARLASANEDRHLYDWEWWSRGPAAKDEQVVGGE